MGSVHKFQRPPNNQQQFKGYRPTSSNGRGRKSSRWHLRSGQKSALAWSVLVLVAVGIWGIGKLL
jgi:hypothetical protein